MLGRKDDRPLLPHTSTSCLHIYSSSLSIKFVSWFVSDAKRLSANDTCALKEYAHLLDFILSFLAAPVVLPIVN